MKIIVSGATGLIGRELVQRLAAKGHDVTCLVRGRIEWQAWDRMSVVRWDVERGVIEDVSKLEAHDAVVHLAGEPVAEGRWTEEKKRRIRDSRVQGTKFLVETCAKLKEPPRAFLSSSAIGFYGFNHADEILTEASPAGSDFLARVCVEWEDAARPAEAFGARTVYLRTGVVLTKEGGALAKLLPIFKLGAGGKVGDGQQFMSWIEFDDELRAIEFLLDNKEAKGAFNLTAPQPVTNAEFTDTLARVLSRPAFFKVPAFAAKLGFGEMADSLLLGGARVVPERLQAAGFQFKFPQLEPALRSLLK